MTNRAKQEPQTQFLDVLDCEEAKRRFHAAINVTVRRVEDISLSEALGRVLAEDVASKVDVPSFDRSNLDGYAIVAENSFGASEEAPRKLTLRHERIATAWNPDFCIDAGQAVEIATGGMIPRGADAVVMLEHADVDADSLSVRHPVTPGYGIAFAGTDICRGEVVLRQGQRLSSRETGVLAAIGVHRLSVYQKPRIAVISTGDEIISPSAEMQPGLVYDSNAQILADSIRELDGIPIPMGIVRDDEKDLEACLKNAIEECDVVLLSGGTSKGAGDLSYRVISRFTRPGIVVHGVAIKPGKPICLASHCGKPIAILPGFPTSAIFTFHEFIAPIIRAMAQSEDDSRTCVDATMAVKLNSAIGRQEFVLLGLVQNPITRSLVAFPMGQGSGSVTTFSRADGFTVLAKNDERLDAGASIKVQLLGRRLELADLVVIGSHCMKLDRILSAVHRRGITVKFLAVGSQAGIEAANRGECDLAGIHLFDSRSGIYNQSFITPQLALIPGYLRRQGIVYRKADTRFFFTSAQEAFLELRKNNDVRMVNRNPGSGTRVLTDLWLEGAHPPGYQVQVRSHQAVVASISQHRADWGVAIEWVVDSKTMGFLPIQDEHFDFAAPRDRMHRAEVQLFREVLNEYRSQDCTGL